MQKYLPIKFYQKREQQDERLILGAGNNTPPKWVLSGTELSDRITSLSGEIDDVIQAIEARNKEYEFIPAVVSVELDDAAIAKSHRASIKDIFGREREQKIVGFNNENELLIRVDSVNDAKLVKQKINNSQKYAKGISAITEISPYKPSLYGFEDVKECKIIKASLFNFYDFKLNKAIKDAFYDFCVERDVSVKESFYGDDLIIFRLENIKSKEDYEQIIDFPAVQFLEPMPMFRIELDAIDEPEEIEIIQPDNDREYPVVGVLDSGIADIPHLQPWLLGHTSSYPEDMIDRSHGTFVGGVVSYGDILEGKAITGVSGCKLFDATVLPDTSKETVAEDELLENIREAISQNRNIRVWNLSMGYQDMEVDSCNFSQFGIALDNLQQEYDVIICKSAGNCKNFVKNQPVGKITVPSDSILSLVVGSVSNNGSPSVFSRVGYGPANINKPDLVSYGGNCVKVGGKFVMEGVKSFGVAGEATENVGTSFSTPRVSSLVSALDFEINEEFDPLLIKALAIHSAKYPDGLKLSQEDRVKLMGYGIPDNIDGILYNSDHEITLIQSDRLVKGSYLEILEFPYPESLVDEHGYFYGNITITLVTAPVLFPGNGSEYCQSNIDVIFGTFDEIEAKEINRVNKNEYGPDGLNNMLLPEKYRARFINADHDNPFTRERTLLKYGKKYQPTKKWNIDLSELTPANKEKLLKAPKKWGLRLTGHYRDFAETRAGLDGQQLFQDFCLIITIKDTRNEKMVYNEVSQLLETRNFIHNDIQLRENIHEHVRV